MVFHSIGGRQTINKVRRIVNTVKETNTTEGDKAG